MGQKTTWPRRLSTAAARHTASNRSWRTVGPSPGGPR
jgi:hypothetical protein